MQEIVVISGKGGTGKTSISTSFAQLEGSNAVIADCDVDAANMHILTGADFAFSEDFYSGFIASIDRDKCTGCSKCREVCHFDAISDDFRIKEIGCEGCGYCSIVCPENAISMNKAYSGRLFVSTTRFNNKLVHAKLEIAGENSGKLVTEVKNQARSIAEKDNMGLILIDGSPGIGCPVIASLAGASLALIITEPTVSAYNDLIRVYDLISKSAIPAMIIINKSDLNKMYRDKIISFSKTKNVSIVGEIPYHNSFTEAMSQTKTILEYDQNGISDLLKKTWTTIKNKLL